MTPNSQPTKPTIVNSFTGLPDSTNLFLFEMKLFKKKVHHTYRLQFMKDVVLARALDDSTFNVLNSCIIFNQIDIINHVQHDAAFLREVVGLYVDDDMLSGGGVKKKDKEGAGPKSAEGMDVDKSPISDAKPNGVSINGQSARAGLYAFAPPDELSGDEKSLRSEVVLLIQQLCVMGKKRTATSTYGVIPYAC